MDASSSEGTRFEEGNRQPVEVQLGSITYQWRQVAPLQTSAHTGGHYTRNVVGDVEGPHAQRLATELVLVLCIVYRFECTHYFAYYSRINLRLYSNTCQKHQSNLSVRSEVAFGIDGHVDGRMSKVDLFIRNLIH